MAKSQAVELLRTPVVPVCGAQPDQPGHHRPSTASIQKFVRLLSGTWPVQPPQSLLSLVAVPPPGSSGTTVRSRLGCTTPGYHPWGGGWVSTTSQRYIRSHERYNRWENTTSSRKRRGALSLSKDKVGKGGCGKCVREKIPQLLPMWIPS